MRTVRFTRTVVLLLALAAAPLTHAEPAGQLAKISHSATTLEWQPAVSGAGFTLTVSGPDGFYLRQEVAPGASARFGAFDEDGFPRPDGAYVYELRLALHLDDEARRAVEPLRGTGLAAKALTDAGLAPARTVESGSFAIVDGVIVRGAEEPRPEGPNRLAEKATILTISDGTINNSLCVGSSCTSSPPFGDSTILVQETTVRLKFDDTSTSSFPDRDWELTANDTGGGVIERFSISDCGTGSGSGCTDIEVFSVEAGVRENALYIEQDGEIGLGTANPAADIHIVTGDTPKLRLEQDGSQGFSAQTWEVLGNEAGLLIQDVTAGSFVYPFRIEPGAGTHALVIENGGEVGLGTLNPEASLHVLGTSGSTRVLVTEGSGTASLRTLLSLQNNGGVRLAMNDMNITSANNDISLNPNVAVNVNGDLSVTGVKSFVVPDPDHADREIYYAALEGPEAGTYYRGRAKTVDGVVEIELPRVFSRLTEAEGMTVQLTPINGWGRLYVDEPRPERLVVRLAEGEPEDLEFYYLVQGVRKGYGEFEVERMKVTDR